MTPSLWLAQIILASALIMDGVPQVFFDYTSLVEDDTWMSHYSPLFIKLKGWLELLGALGVITPPKLSLYPSVNLIATTGVLLLLLGVILMRLLTGGEGPPWTLMITLTTLAAFVSCTHLRQQYAWGRIS